MVYFSFPTPNFKHPFLPQLSSFQLEKVPFDLEKNSRRDDTRNVFFFFFNWALLAVQRLFNYPF